MLTTPRSIFFIGAGFISRFSHAAALARLADGESCLISVADPSPAALEEFRKVVPRAETFADYQTMLTSRAATPDDFVVVAAPPFLHLAMVKEAFASGRHVLCEKPLGISRDEGREMLAAAKKAGKLLGCCSTRIANSGVTGAVRDLIASGQLGEIYHATMVIRQTRCRTGIEYQPGSRFFIDKSKNGGGPVSDWGPYELTTMLDALNPDQIEVVQAWTSRPETAIDPTDCVFDVESHAGATLRFFSQNNRPVVVDYERAFCTHGDESPAAPMTYQIEGTKGAVKWEWITDGQGHLWHSYDRAGQRVTEEIEVPKADDEHMHSKPMVYFDRAVRGEESPAYVNEDALFSFELIRAIYECAETGQIQLLKR